MAAQQADSQPEPHGSRTWVYPPRLGDPAEV
ncbi:hypothetical protein BJ970_006757 [Saccharopolyspora phatthalungensis]|uniref:Uncharacterized protein n=1 Tax=Saccharopolyspora phatthalungensis TaxID=664693 RepID=A0A840QJ95_9PSEU|nr:hypothetical protein [Saccharopolyspora phatthalungensis]